MLISARDVPISTKRYALFKIEILDCKSEQLMAGTQVFESLRLEFMTLDSVEFKKFTQ